MIHVMARINVKPESAATAHMGTPHIAAAGPMLTAPPEILTFAKLV